MTDRMYETIRVDGGSEIKMWTRGVPVEPEARAQLEKTARMPFIFRHLAVRPDVHVGKGSTVGSVTPTVRAILPAAVGVDLGCGMIAVKTTLTAADLPDNLARRAAVRHGTLDCRGHAGQVVWKIGNR